MWQADVGTLLIPWLADHKVHGQAVMPATGFAEMALAAGCEAFGLPANAIAVNRVEVEQMLRLEDRTQVTTQLIQGQGAKAPSTAVGSRSIHARPTAIGIGMRSPEST